MVLERVVGYQEKGLKVAAIVNNKADLYVFCNLVTLDQEQSDRESCAGIVASEVLF